MQKNVRLRLMALSLACAVVPFLGAGAAAARTTDDPDLTRQSTAAAGKPPTRDTTGPRGQVPGGFADWNALFSEQTRLNGVADRILARAETADGYGGIIVAPENHEVRLYWKGSMPSAVQSLIDEGRLTAPVSVLPAAHSYAELLAEADKWSESGQVTGAAPQPDGSGVQISVAGPGHQPRPAPATERRHRADHLGPGRELRPGRPDLERHDRRRLHQAARLPVLTSRG
ncbi:hypothetical protein AB0J71_47810 [Nonomuraea sp. NPDC049637]|uniref:hypothetical protein n=1 Tax=Nonomuraea sp. NPDC049637 TaxID=3154356 RepID=UPI00342E9EAA